ncbi:aminotransferase class I/II-fold pyridoxal phosphate-dependent enzyme [Corynebacterium sp. HMSC077B05]|uniref:aminotransferase class I/II-fold pyridoxal phosphate-dependent enzyme n=1 Tax=Corynebacterium sp. HMSC077B05 TaxID=1739252 RepID=UPI0008A4B6B5|nr:aminotransferase class I/II-fold pyridoxal phosphate-dependent enzyme [Corynebacterium sp. HMSC077B05]OFL76545.1 aminotransferase [Corynebacterium sp. HMSC077B05]
MTVQRLQQCGETVFSTMTALATKHNAINLGQGFPDTDGPARMLEIAQEQIATGHNQYAPLRGVPQLLDALSAHCGVPTDHLVVTAGATEAITATVLGLVEPGQEVIVLEPYYDAYAAAIALADATRVPVPLTPTVGTWDLDVDAVRAAVTDKTAMIIINSPHNPTGSVFSRPALDALAELCVEHDLLILADEVYEDLVFHGSFTSVRDLPGMAERTIKISSAAKSFNATGWKTGWAIATPELLDGVIKAKQFMSFVSTTPFQPAVAHALTHEQQWQTNMVTGLEECRDILAEGLASLGYEVFATPGTYYLVADVHEDAIEFCTRLPAERGVAAIPLSAFTDNPEPWKNLVRFAFCKRPEVIREAVKRLTA